MVCGDGDSAAADAPQSDTDDELARCLARVAEEALGGAASTARVRRVAAAVRAGRTDVCAVAEALRAPLTGPASARAAGLAVLSDVLGALSPGALRGRLEVLVEFYAARAGDPASAAPWLAGAARLAAAGPARAAASRLLGALLDGPDCQAQPRALRALYYTALRHLLCAHHQLLECAQLAALAAALEGERDPHLLLLAWALVPRALPAPPATATPAAPAHLDPLWDALACYFPVDYTPPPAAPGVAPAPSRRRLASALAAALCCTPLFAEPCLLLLVDKLDSSSRLAKLDSLQLLEESCRVFPPDAYLPFLASLWSELHRLLAAPAASLAAAAARSLAALARRLDPRPALLDLVLPAAAAAAAAHLPRAALAALARAGRASCLRTVRALVPPLLADPSSAPAALAMLHEAAELHGALADLAEPLGDAAALCHDMLAAPSAARRPALLALARLASALPAARAQPLAADLLRLALAAPDSQELDAVLGALRDLAATHPAPVERAALEAPAGERRLLILATIGDRAPAALTRLLAELAAPGALRSTRAGLSVWSDAILHCLESQHGLTDRVLLRLRDLLADPGAAAAPTTLADGCELVADTLARSEPANRDLLLATHAPPLLEMCASNVAGAVLVLEALYRTAPGAADAASRAALAAGVRAALDAAAWETRAAGVRLVASLVRHAPPADLPALLELLPEARRPATPALAAAVAGALLHRSGSLADCWLRQVIQCLHDEATCDEAAAAIRALCAAAVGLHRQRLLLALLTAHAPVPAAVAPRAAYLAALAAAAAAAPVPALLDTAHQMGPLLLEALSLGPGQQAAAARPALAAAEVLLRARALSLSAALPALLDLLAHPDMKVRIASLECARAAATHYRTVELLPHRAAAALRLERARADHKRLVRAAAARAAQRWWAVGAPGEP